MNARKQVIFFGESFSPWAKKARWALEQCELAYEYREYTPTLSEPGLRWRMGQWTGTVSVPVLFSGDRILRGSWEIANHANQLSADKRLGDLQAVEPWNELSEAALAEGRTAILRKILASPKALEQSLPPFVPGLLQTPLRFLARDAVRRLDRKYAHLVRPGALR